MIPLILFGFNPFSGFLIRGCRSIISYILAAACFPSPIFYRAGVSWLRLNPDITILKNTTKTSPAVYLAVELEKLG